MINIYISNIIFTFMGGRGKGCCPDLHLIQRWMMKNMEGGEVHGLLFTLRVGLCDDGSLGVPQHFPFTCATASRIAMPICAVRGKQGHSRRS